jgi:hypothetical protein
MSNQENLQPRLRQKANDILGRLSPSQREALLVKSWMSHDARWFMAVVGEYGVQVANRLNRIAAHEVGKVEAQRIARALQLPRVKNLDDYLLAHELFIGLVGPDLMDYQLIKVGDNAYQVHVQRCFAYENAVSAGVADNLQCGIFSRITGWPEALGLDYEISPSLEKCVKAEGWECIHTLTLKVETPLTATPVADPE